MPINTAVNGPYCHPIVSGLALSMNATGHFSSNIVDVFAGPAWDEARRRSQEKALEMRKQGFFGPAMLPMSELEYGGIVARLRRLEEEFVVAKEAAKAPAGTE